MNEFAHAVPTIDFVGSYKELMLGAGSSKERKVYDQGEEKKPFKNLVTVDFEASHNTDVVHDLNITPWPFADNEFDEIHAYEVLEHLGQQGDFRSFFAQFMEIWRILKPGGRLYATCPMWDSPWAWGDPGHTRIITKHSLVFLSQDQYKQQIGKTAMADYRAFFTGDFKIIAAQEAKDTLAFVIEAIK